MSSDFKIHFISGLPRSGSTLLGGILRQNPRFSGGMSSPLGGIVGGLIRSMGAENEFSVFIDDKKRERIIRAAIDAYYGDVPELEVAFDTNRSWTVRLPLITQLFPDAKVIACVRSPAWIVDSVERLVRKNALEHSKLFNQAERETVFSRVDAVMKPGRMVGFPLNALKEAYYSDLADRLLLLEYETLCTRPQEAIALIYKFLGEEPFEHDFDNVDYDAEEFDAKMATPGLHTVRRKVSFEPRQTILPPEIFNRLDQLSFWRDFSRTKAFRIVEDTKARGDAPAGTAHH